MIKTPAPLRVNIDSTRNGIHIHIATERLFSSLESAADRKPGAYPHPFTVTPVERIHVSEPKRLTLDAAGYFVVYPDTRAKRLVVEHYTNQGVFNCVLEGASTGALYGEAIERRLLTRLDHAAYLGRELARAEASLRDGTPFVQDAAPGEHSSSTKGVCATGSSCGCSPTPPTKGCC
jgi:tetrahydromethanopterin S-methyltransferase subunit A